MQLAKKMLETHVSYHHWATSEMCESVRPLPAEALRLPRGTSFVSLLGTLDHMYRVDQLWLARLESEPTIALSSLDVPESWEGLERGWMVVRTKLEQFVSQHDPEALRTFANSAGTRFTMPIWQIVLHIVNHGASHRGQVNTILRQIGIAPRGTDLVQYIRMSRNERQSKNGAVTHRTEGLYHDRKFICTENSNAGQTNDHTIFHYRQSGSAVWATYEGGAIQLGTLIATVGASNDLSMKYQHIDKTGALRSGTCQSTPELLPDGRLMLHERWQWDAGELGSSTLMEI